MSDRAPRRRGPILPPIAYPLLGLVFGGILVFSFSRVLLAVSVLMAPTIALLMALNVLVGAALVAYGRRVRHRPASYPLLLIGAVGVIAVGVMALTLNPRPVEHAAAEGEASAQTVKLEAKDITFDTTSLSFTAGAPIKLEFDNADTGIPHNFALFADEAKTQVLFAGDIITGPKAVTYSFTAPDKPGTYYFHCDVHPTQMDGTVTVSAGGGGGGGTTAALQAKNTAFSPSTLTVKGGGQITIAFDNADAGIPHNVQVFDGEDATAPSLFLGDLVTGPVEKDYTFAAPPPGRYFFHCDVHPTQMTGTLVVT